MGLSRQMGVSSQLRIHWGMYTCIFLARITFDKNPSQSLKESELSCCHKCVLLLTTNMRRWMNLSTHFILAPSVLFLSGEFGNFNAIMIMLFLARLIPSLSNWLIWSRSKFSSFLDVWGVLPVISARRFFFQWLSERSALFQPIPS